MRRPITKPCEVPGCDRVCRSKKARFCRMHEYRVQRYGSTDDPCREVLCRVCGVLFMQSRSDASTCERADCKASAAREDMKRRAGEVRAGAPVRVSDVLPVEDAVAPVESLDMFTRSDVGDRDGWCCHLCGGHVDRLLQWPNPDSLTLDLVDPFGPRSFSNCRVAHLRCVGEFAV